MLKSHLRLLILLIFFLLLPCSALAQTVPPEPVKGNEAPKVEELIKSLENIYHSHVKVDSEIQRLKKERAAAITEGQKQRISDRMEVLERDSADLENDFLEIATGVEVEELKKPTDPEEFQWANELTELLAPLINEIKRATSNPREIDRLKTQLDSHKQQSIILKAGMERLEVLAQYAVEPTRAQLLELQHEWEDKHARLLTQVSLVTQKLQQRENDRKDLMASLKEVFNIFFQSRGRNLLIAIFSTVLFWFVIRQAFNWVQQTDFYKSRSQPAYARCINVIYLMFSGGGSFGVFLFVLFLYGDWVLLSIGVLIVLGIVWTSRQTLPHFWNQITLLLNMGAVREAERVVYNGLPWHVGRIGLYTRFVNPALEGALLRVPIKDLEPLRSRVFLENLEIWFPTRLHDWVIDPDGHLGTVIRQSPELVTLRLNGGVLKTFLTADFIKLPLKVLSHGFRIKLVHCLDNVHLQDAVEEIPARLEAFLNEHLTTVGLNKHLVHLSVQFDEAGASSLNLAAIVDFDGEVAKDYEVLKRMLARKYVEACAKYGWVIAYPNLAIKIEENNAPGKLEDILNAG